VPRATAQGIHFRSTAIVQSVSGDARDVPLTTEFLGWSYGLEEEEIDSTSVVELDAMLLYQMRPAKTALTLMNTWITLGIEMYQLSLVRFGGCRRIFSTYNALRQHIKW